MCAVGGTAPPTPAGLPPPHPPPPLPLPAYLNVERVKGVTREVTGEDEGAWVPVMGFECRGLEPVSARLGEFAVRSSGGATFVADLEEG